MTGAQLKGTRRIIFLLDGVPRELTYDFNALAVIERQFTAPLSKVVAELKAEIERRMPKDEKGNIKDAAAADKELEQVITERGIHLEVGTLENAGRWAYAMTETWREDNGESMTWQQFKKILPVAPLHKAEQEQWQAAVFAHMMDQYEATAGNAQSGGSAGEAPPVLSAPSTGTAPTGETSITSSPSSGDEPITPSGD